MPAVSSIIAGGSAVLGAGSSIIAGNKAAKAQKNAADQAAANERYFFDTAREDQAPYRAVGTGALSKLAQMYGVEPTPETDYAGYVRDNPDLLAEYQKNPMQWGSLEDYGKFHYDTYGQGEGRSLPAAAKTPASGVGAYGGFMESPGYRFRMDEGTKAIERSMAARGLFSSGPAAKALTRFAQGTASEEFDKYANALRSMAGIGQTATNATQAAGAQAAGGISQALTAGGNARASSYANTGAAINNGISNVMGAYLMRGQGSAPTPKLPYDLGGIWN